VAVGRYGRLARVTADDRPWKLLYDDQAAVEVEHRRGREGRTACVLGLRVWVWMWAWAWAWVWALGCGTYECAETATLHGCAVVSV
jgi:hypothetical protein